MNGSGSRGTDWLLARVCVLALMAWGIGAATFGSAAPALAAPAQVASVSQGNVNCTTQLPATVLDHAVPWAQRALGFQRVWPITEGAGVTVAVVDTGVDAAQPFLQGAVLPGTDVINGGGQSGNTDCDGHGTFVAGIIAGRPQAGFGFAGVAPQAQVLPIRQANSTSDGTAQTLANGIRAAVNMGAQVINVSIVTPTPTAGLLDAVNYALAHDVVIVAAAGNDFTQGNAVQYPAGFPGVLSVAAIDANGQRAGFSETGHIGVAAPGTNLLGPGAGGPGLVVMQGGTSFATPFVAGVAALVRSYYPNMTAPQVIQRIEATADHPPGQLPAADLGWGVVDPYAAVTAVLPAQASPGAAARSPVPRPVAHPSGLRGAGLAAGAGVAVTLLAIGILLSARVVRRGRQRGWRPAAAGEPPAKQGAGQLSGGRSAT